MPATFDGELERIRQARGMGVVPPAFLLDKAIGQMEQTIASAGKGELFAADLRGKLQAMDMPESHANRAAILEAGPIAEALTRQLEELRAERAVASDAPGISTRPRGDEFYGWALRSSTTTRLTPDEVHRQGLDELDALHARMDPILRGIGYTSGSVGERMQALSQDPRYNAAEGDPAARDHGFHRRAGRADQGADAARLQHAGRSQHGGAVFRPPRKSAPAPMAARAARMAAFPAGSGSICAPPTCTANTTSPISPITRRSRPWRANIRTAAADRSICLQSFSEGWAPMASRSPTNWAPMTGSRSVGWATCRASPSACCMVVDTGLHAKGWSRAKAVDFFVTRNGSKPAEVESEVDRYCSWPGRRRDTSSATAVWSTSAQGRSGIGRGLRLQGVQRRGRAGRQCPDGRAREECRSLYRGAGA